eukprot:jgi/Botrbrau1/16477/Bobra.0142s0071.1
MSRRMWKAHHKYGGKHCRESHHGGRRLGKERREAHSAMTLILVIVDDPPEFIDEGPRMLTWGPSHSLLSIMFASYESLGEGPSRFQQ